jgi:hypothetical protein
MNGPISLFAWGAWPNGDGAWIHLPIPLSTDRSINEHMATAARLADLLITNKAVAAPFALAAVVHWQGGGEPPESCVRGAWANQAAVSALGSIEEIYADAEKAVANFYSGDVVNLAIETSKGGESHA